MNLIHLERFYLVICLMAFQHLVSYLMPEFDSFVKVWFLCLKAYQSAYLKYPYQILIIHKQLSILKQLFLFNDTLFYTKMVSKILI